MRSPSERGGGPSGSSRQQRLVAIGASAGGPAALATVLRGLPKNFPAAIVIIQHVDEHFASGMAEWLSQQSALPVQVAKEGDRPTVGTVLLAGTSDHLRLTASDRLGYTREPQDYVYRPSIDVFFHSVSELWPGEARGRAVERHGAGRCAGLESATQQRALHHRAGPSEQRGLWHAQGRRRLGCRGRHLADRTNRARTSKCLCPPTLRQED